MRLIDADAILKQWRFDNELVMVVDVIDIREAPTIDLFSLPYGIGTTVYANGSIGTVEEIALNSDGCFLYVSSGGGGFYVRPDKITRYGAKMDGDKQ